MRGHVHERPRKICGHDAGCALRVVERERAEQRDGVIAADRRHPSAQLVAQHVARRQVAVRLWTLRRQLQCLLKRAHSRQLWTEPHERAATHSK